MFPSFGQTSLDSLTFFPWAEVSLIDFIEILFYSEEKSPLIDEGQLNGSNIEDWLHKVRSSPSIGIAV